MSITQIQNSVPGSRGSESADPRVGFFNELAPRWDRECSDPAGTLARLGVLAERLRLRPGQDVLELGCGTGQITGWLADRVRPGRVVAADFAPSMLDQARARGQEANVQLLDICREPAGARFDVVLCFNAFPHFRDKAAALRNIAASLKLGGRLLILHLSGRAKLNAFHQGLREPVCHDLLPDAGAWPGLLGRAGLRCVELADQDDLFLLECDAAECRPSPGRLPHPA